jgi:hypothetical protein
MLKIFFEGFVIEYQLYGDDIIREVVERIADQQEQNPLYWEVY